MLTTQQLQMLKADIAADPVLSAYPNNSDGSYEIAKAYNLQASPNFTVWKKSVPVSDVGEAMKSSEVAGLTTADTNRLMVLVQYAGGNFNPSLTETRAGFDDIFSGAGGTQTRQALLVLWRRLATRGEKLFATGTGTDASPATSAFEDGWTLAYQDVDAARNLP